MMEDYIVAIQCKKCKNIIFSRERRDYRACNCGSVAIDSNGRRIIGDFKSFNEIELSKSVLCDMVLSYDFMFGNKNVKNEFLDGYYGKFVLTEHSNKNFFGKLVVNGELEYI